MTDAELITTAFTAASTAEEVLHGMDLTGVCAIVTGGSSGIGVETARVLAAAGARVTLAVRNTEAGNAVADEIKHSTGATRPDVARLDLANRRSIIDFVEAWRGALASPHQQCRARHERPRTHG